MVVKYLHFIQAGKISTLVDCGKLCIHNATPRETTKIQIIELIQKVFSNHNGIKIGSQ